jgi:hypothetical protein
MSEQLPPPELELLLEDELEELLDDEDELDELLDEEELDELLLEDELEELLDDEPPPNCASIQPWKRSYVHWFRPHSP